MISTPQQRDPKRCGTDPCCPHVWATPADDAPFIIESDYELPAGTGMRVGDEMTQDTIGLLRRDTRTHMKMPSTMCQNFTNATAKSPSSMVSLRPRARPRHIRTRIVFDDRGIMEIYHIGRQATETEAGRRDIPG